MAGIRNDLAREARRLPTARCAECGAALLARARPGAFYLCAPCAGLSPAGLLAHMARRLPDPVLEKES